MSRLRNNIPQRRFRPRPPLTVMQQPLTRQEVDRLHAHMRRHGACSLTPRQHDAIWDFLFDLPESKAWIANMTAQIEAGQAAMRPHSAAKSVQAD